MPYLIAALTLAAAGLLFLQLIKPARNQGQMDRFLHRHYAHRGLHNLATGIPENSLAAFAAAADAGYGMELDVQLTKEGIPVVFHDYSLSRMCGVSGAVKDMTFTELQTLALSGTEERIRSLDQVLRLVNGRVPLIIEIKGESPHTAICSQVHHTLRYYRGDYESFNPLYLRWWRTNAPEVLLGQLSARLQTDKGQSPMVRLQRWAITHLLTNAFTRPDFIAYNWQDTQNLSYRLCRHLWQAVTVLWTVDQASVFTEVSEQCHAVIFEGFLPPQGSK